MRSEVFAGGAHIEPIRVFFKPGKKIGEPTILITELVSAGPDAELFHVVAHGRHAAGMNAGRFAQEGDHLFDFAEGDDVAQLLLAGVEPHAVAAVLCDVRAEKLLGLKAGGEEMHVIHQSVGHVGGSEGRGKLRLPDALGKPCAVGPLPKMFFEIAGKSRDLFKLVFGRNGDKNRFVEPAADEFHLAALD